MSTPNPCHSQNQTLPSFKRLRSLQITWDSVGRRATVRVSIRAMLPSAVNALEVRYAGISTQLGALASSLFGKEVSAGDDGPDGGTGTQAVRPYQRTPHCVRPAEEVVSQCRHGKGAQRKGDEIHQQHLNGHDLGANRRR